MQRKLLLLIALVACLAAPAKAQQVTNADFHQEGQTVVITYDLDKVANISVSFSNDGGYTFHKLRSVSGDVGKNVLPGSKRIVWDVLKDVSQLDDSNFAFRINVVKNSGYRGFVSVGAGTGIGTFNTDNAIISISTTHGYVWNNGFFMGIGMECMNMGNVSHRYDWDKVYINERMLGSLYGNIAWRFKHTNTTPFIDLRGGFHLNSDAHLYLSGAFGYRISTDHGSAINLMAGYECRWLDFHVGHYIYDNSTLTWPMSGLRFGLGIEF